LLLPAKPFKNVMLESLADSSLKEGEIILADTRERIKAEAQFKKAQKHKEGAEVMAAYVAEAEAVRAKTARLKELRLAKEAVDKTVKNHPVEKTKKRST
jgi:hypothetical protein